MSHAWSDVDEALARLERILRPRVGKRMTALCVQNLVRLKETGSSRETVLHAIHTSIDAYGRLEESGAPFPVARESDGVDVNRIIGARGCRKLFQLNSGAPVDMVKLVATHADALVPAYGADDAEFAIRIAWKNAHHYLLNLVVGRAFDRNDATPSRLLHAAWQAQGAPLVDARLRSGWCPTSFRVRA